MEKPSDRKWRGSPLDMSEGLDPYGIREVILEFESGDSDAFRPRLREEFGSYELNQMAAYTDTLAHALRTGRNR